MAKEETSFLHHFVKKRQKVRLSVIGNQLMGRRQTYR
jgi:hypothetical protein